MGYGVIWLAVPHLGVFARSVMMLVFIALFMLVQLSITRWFVSLEIKPAWSAVIMAASFSATIAIMLAVSAPYLRYETKDGPLPPMKPKPGVKPAATIELTIVKTDKNAKPVTEKTTAVRKPADLGFRLAVFGYHAKGSRAVTSLLIIIGSSAMGLLVSLILRHPNIILPVAVFSAMVDIWTVFLGPTGKAVANAPHVVQAVSVALPDPGQGYAPISFIGPADVIFFAMFMAAIYRLKMEPVRTFWIAFPLLTLGMASVIQFSGTPGLPALILIGAAVIIGNWKHFKLTRQEYIYVGIVMLVLIALTAAVTPFVGK